MDAKADESANQTNRKRKLSIDDNTNDQPNLKVLSSCVQNTEVSEASLLDLSDEILIEIFLNVDSESLISLSQTCLRLNNVAKDRKLWIHADFTQSTLSAHEVIRKLAFMGPLAKSLKIKGQVGHYPLEKWKNFTITPNILQTLSKTCPNLERLEIHEGYLDTGKIGISQFPSSLKALVFKKCEVDITAKHCELQLTSFLSKIDRSLKELEDLTIEECSWFDSHDFMVLSKIVNLKRLSLKGCKSLKGSVPYASIAARFGFRMLETLDIRDTPVADADISCFNITPTLKELCMECPENLRNQTTPNDRNETEGRPAPAEPNGHANLDVDDHPNAGENEDNNRNNDDDNVNYLRLFNRRNWQERLRNPNLNNDQPANEEQFIRIVNREILPVPNIGEERASNFIRLLNRNMVEDPPNANEPPVNNEEARANFMQYIHDRQQREQRNNFVQIGNRRVNFQQHLEPPEPVPDDLNARLVLQARNPNARILPHVIIVRGVENNNPVAEVAENPRGNQIYRYLNVEPDVLPLVSDRGICSYGISRNFGVQGIIFIRCENRPQVTSLEKLIIRHYKMVTDTSLEHLESAAPYLRLLDVTGTSVTEEGVQRFRSAKPNCMIVSSFDVKVE